MKTIVIVGAGPGLGLSLAKVFGKKGFRVAMISRTQEKLDDYANQLGLLGITAQGFAADVTNKTQLARAFQQIKNVYGIIDVVEFSPHSGSVPVTTALEVTEETVLQILDHVVVGAVSTARQVIPDMMDRGTGTLLFTSDLSAMNASPLFGNTGIAMAGLRNYVLNLHDSLAPHGIYVGHLSISPLIKKGTGFDPDQVAETWYDMYEQRLLKEETFPKGIMKFLT